MKLEALNAGEQSVPSEDALDEGESARVTARRMFIEQSAILLGRAWADGCRKELRREGRPAAGGWPGTLREARTRVGQALTLELRGRKMPAMTEVEREIAARAAYASARIEWRKHLDPEVP